MTARSRRTMRAVAEAVAKQPRGRSAKNVKVHRAGSAPADVELSTSVAIPSAAMNRWERQMADWLALGESIGEIKWWAFEPLRFRIGKGAFYTPDFVVVDELGQLVAYEVKGHWEEDARVRIKVAASRYRWVRFVVVKAASKGALTFEPVLAHG